MGHFYFNKVLFTKTLIFTVLYFIFIFVIDSKLKITKSLFNIEISNLNLDQLPKHYLNMNNLIDLNENLILYKKFYKKLFWRKSLFIQFYKKSLFRKHRS